MLKVSLIKKDDFHNEDDEDKEKDPANKNNSQTQEMELINNLCSFSNGNCEMYNLQVIAVPSTYILNVRVESFSNYPLNFNFKDFEVQILDCREDQIKLYKNGITYCENPVCKPECPTAFSAKCVPNRKVNYNSMESNYCTCLPGWEGVNCSEKIFIDFSSVDHILLIENVSILIILGLYQIFIIINRKNGIIYDLGSLKISILVLGLMLYFSSNLFITYMNLSNCVINFILKHIGISLVLLVYYIINIVCKELGVKLEKEDEKEFETLSSEFLPPPPLDFKEDDFSKDDIPSSNNENNIPIKATRVYNDSNSNIDKLFTTNNFSNSISFMSINDFKKEFQDQSDDDSRSNWSKSTQEYNRSKLENLIMLKIVNEKKREYHEKRNSDIRGSLIDKLNVIKRNNNNNNNSSLMKQKYVGIMDSAHSLNQKDQKENDRYSSISNSEDDLPIPGNEKDLYSPNEFLIKSVENAHDLFIKTLIIYMIYILSLVVILLAKIVKIKNNMYLDDTHQIIQFSDGLWSYTCNLERADLFYNIAEFIILTFILGKGKAIIEYNLVFKCTKYITYSSCVCIILGPLTNVISYIILKNQRFEKVLFDVTLNMIAYLVIFILFSWDKIYYILRKEGNNIKHYEKCILHDSYKCGCVLLEKKRNQSTIVSKYLQFYKYSTKLLDPKNKKIKKFDLRDIMDIIEQ